VRDDGVAIAETHDLAQDPRPDATPDGAAEGPTDAAADVGADASDGGRDSAADRASAVDARPACDGVPSGTWEFLGPSLKGSDSGYVTRPALTLLSDDRPVVGWSEAGMVYTRAWTQAGCGAGEWAPMGVVSSSGDSPFLATDDKGSVVRAIVIGTSLSVERWDGNAFLRLGDQMPTLRFGIDGPIIQPAAAGNLYVAWADSELSPYSTVQVARWDGARWILLTDSGGVLGSFVYSQRNGVGLALTPAGVPVVAWPTYSNATVVAQFASNTTWTMLGAMMPDAVGGAGTNGPRLSVTGDGNLFLSWSGRTMQPASSPNVFGAQLDGGSWRAGVPIMTGIPLRGWTMAVDGTGVPVVVTQGHVGTEAGNRLFGYRWDGTGWQAATPELVGVPMTYQFEPIMAVDSRGRWVVAWGEESGKQDVGNLGRIFVARYQP
jgi:hypothetical protein